MGGDAPRPAGEVDRGPARAFIATTHERGQIHDAEIALDADGRILGVRDEFLHDTGAYIPTA